MKRPDFGVVTMEYDGLLLEAKAIVPKLTLHDLVRVYEKAFKNTPEGDSLSGNPNKWPVVQGVDAVVEAVLDAIYERDEE